MRDFGLYPRRDFCFLLSVLQALSSNIMDLQNQSSDRKIQNITLRLILAWIFGLIFLILGSILLYGDFIVGAALLVCSMIALPPFNKFLKEKMRLTLSGVLRVIIIIVLLFASITISGFMAPSNASSSHVALGTQYNQTVSVPTSQQTTSQTSKPQIKNTGDAVVEKQTPIITPKSVPAPVSLPDFTSPTNASLGIRTQILKGIYLTVNKPEDYTSDNPDSYYQPKAGNKYISVYASFQNQSQSPFDYNENNFSVIDPSGGKYGIRIGYATKSPDLYYGTLNPSNIASGYAIFEVPDAIPAGQFAVHFESYSDPEAVVDFK
jgi:hypothetical protein